MSANNEQPLQNWWQHYFDEMDIPAHRIWTRLSREMPEVTVAESTVRKYVRQRKAAMGLLGLETFVPQSYTWGQEGQVDWYEMVAELGGERQKVQIFCLRSMAGAGAPPPMSFAAP
jgi:hypothetical protein